jgi:K+/H+ antiporter YhaU regulatory subunit KhtT
MATEKEREMVEQILEKVTKLENRVTKLGDNVKELVVEQKEVHTGLQATFEKGFSDVRNKLDEIIELNKNRKSAKEIFESIAGKG